MSMKVNFNMSAVLSNDYLRKTDNALTKSMQRLSSGYKINDAGDNPSGIAIGRRMRAQIRSLNQAGQNAGDAVSVVQTAEGALNEIHDMLQRMNELCVKAANGTLSGDGDQEDKDKALGTGNKDGNVSTTTGFITSSDRSMIQEEINQLIVEIERIANTTEFNSRKLLDGTFDLKGYVEKVDNDKVENFTVGKLLDEKDMPAVTVQSYSDETSAGYYALEISIKKEGDDFVVDGLDLLEAQDPSKPCTLEIHGETKQFVMPKVDDEAYLESDGRAATIKGDNGFSITMDVDFSKMKAPAEGKYTVFVNLTGKGAMTEQIGADEGTVIDIRIPKVSAKDLGIWQLNVLDQDNATKSIDRVATAIDRLSAIRSRLGAYQNRLEHTVASLDATEESMTSAFSRIMDTDMAEEMTVYSQQQIMSQAGTSMLAQANQRPSQILQLLQ